MTILIIGYGNDLRCDDGVGRRIAEAVSDWNLPDVDSLSIQQLTPDFSVRLAEVETVIFVDVSTSESQKVRVTPVNYSNSGLTFSHACDPGMLVNLAQTLYGKSPQTWVVEVPGVDFGLGDEISAIAQSQIPIALKKIRDLIQQKSPVIST